MLPRKLGALKYCAPAADDVVLDRATVGLKLTLRPLLLDSSGRVVLPVRFFSELAELVQVLMAPPSATLAAKVPARPHHTWPLTPPGSEFSLPTKRKVWLASVLMLGLPLKLVASAAVSCTPTVADAPAPMVP